MQSWQEFYELLGGAAATLLGLLFVSVSLNAETILGPAHVHSKRLAEQAFQNYLAVLMVSLVAIYPDMGPISLGSTLLWLAGLWGAWAVSRALPALRERPQGSWYAAIRRYISTLLGFGLLIYAGAQMVSEATYHADYVAVGAMALLVSATLVSWDLLIKIAQEKFRASGD